ncbi:uncharacterized protein V6R79_006677 [Siganus canaliculatus]
MYRSSSSGGNAPNYNTEPDLKVVLQHEVLVHVLLKQRRRFQTDGESAHLQRAPCDTTDAVTALFSVLGTS